MVGWLICVCGGRLQLVDCSFGLFGGLGSRSGGFISCLVVELSGILAQVGTWSCQMAQTEQLPAKFIPANTEVQTDPPHRRRGTNFLLGMREACNIGTGQNARGSQLLHRRMTMRLKHRMLIACCASGGSSQADLKGNAQRKLLTFLLQLCLRSWPPLWPRATPN